MKSSSHELNFIQAGVDQLENYLLSDQIYWPVGIRSSANQPAYPQLTLGTLSLYLHQAEALVKEPDLKAVLTRKEKEIDLIHTRWSVHWQKKAAAEFIARLKLWRDFLEEYRKDPEGNYDRYAYEVTRRVMLHWLEKDSPGLQPPETQMLENLDRMLNSIFAQGSFIWDARLMAEYPKETFWYLYGKLPPDWPGVR